MASFGEKLRALRNDRMLSQEELAGKLMTTKQTISRYETGSNSPRIDTAIGIADLLGVDLIALIDDSVSVYEVLKSSRLGVSTPSPTGDHQTDRLMQAYTHLNTSGREIVTTTAEGLHESGRYKRTPSSGPTVTTSDYIDTYSIASAAAGGGSYNDGTYSTFHKLRSDDIPEDYDAQIDVHGDSMEPTIPDGAVAFIDYTIDEPPKDGEIYVFQVGEDTLVKEGYFGPEAWTLKSVNPSYQDIEVRSGDAARVIGRVIAWAMPRE